MCTTQQNFPFRMQNCFKFNASLPTSMLESYMSHQFPVINQVRAQMFTFLVCLRSRNQRPGLLCHPRRYHKKGTHQRSPTRTLHQGKTHASQIFPAKFCDKIPRSIMLWSGLAEQLVVIYCTFTEHITSTSESILTLDDPFT